MDTKDYEQLSETYHIYENLTPHKPWNTYVAYYKNETILNPIILKEMDLKRAHIYKHLSTMWNPHIANVYSVHRLPNSTVSIDNGTEDVYLAVTENLGTTSLADFIYQNGALNIPEALDDTLNKMPS